MPHFSRRDLLATLSSLMAVGAAPALGAVCDVSKTGSGQMARKTYDCRVGPNQRLTATFMRVSDLVIDSIGRGDMPDGFDQILGSQRLLDSKALTTFQDLFEQFSYPFTKYNLALDLDGRQEGGQGFRSYTDTGNIDRIRTLGAWDAWENDPLPIFPLPDLLRRAILQKAPDADFGRFLRYATSADFDDLEGKWEQYIRLWSEVEKEYTFSPDVVETLGGLGLMRHIKAGSVDGFLPLVFHPQFVDGCAGTPYGGAHYVSPGLYVDVAHVRNTGATPIEIEDFFGVEDRTPSLRAYASRTPDGEVRLGLQPTVLQPGDSAMMLQRLLFSGDVLQREWSSDSKIPTKRAVFGPTQLPKGVIVGGQAYPFDGRSHNAVILASYSDGASCPYLYAWCDIAREWVKMGKVLTANSAADKAGTEERALPGVTTRIRLMEREHEVSTITGLSLAVTLRDGIEITLPPQQSVRFPVILNLGQALDVSFALPDGVEASETRLIVSGYYEKYTHTHVAARRAVLSKAGAAEPMGA